jgi:hypothetical protein
MDEGLGYPDDYCCDALHYQFEGTCRGEEHHSTGTEQCPKQLITYAAKFREFHLSPVGLYTYLIHYCPFCGSKFPEDLRDIWWEQLEDLGFGSPLEQFDQLPEAYQTDAWWKQQGL